VIFQKITNITLILSLLKNKKELKALLKTLLFILHTAVVL
jgi:hypothetical protein